MWLWTLSRQFINIAFISMWVYDILAMIWHIAVISFKPLRLPFMTRCSERPNFERSSATLRSCRAALHGVLFSNNV